MTMRKSSRTLRIAREDDLASGIEPFSTVEIAWLESLERVLREQPNRIKIVEIMDSLKLVDRSYAERDVEIYDGKARENGVWLADVADSFGKVTGMG